MTRVSDEQFEQFVADAVAVIPTRFADYLNNVAFLTSDEPSFEQLQAGGVLHGRGTLLGLYEGIPLPQRGDGYSMVVPDIITIFKHPHEMLVHSEAALSAAVHQTVWHEVAHYFGL